MQYSRNAPCPCGSGRKYKRCCDAAEPRQEKPARPTLPRRFPKCSFSCAIECAEFCCGGATLVTIDEIRKIHEFFPLTIGFRKYRPASPRHRNLLETIGIRIGEHFVVGDFIAGNRFAPRCTALGEDSLCSLHARRLKPLQCVIVPFCSVYPEDMQDIVFHEQRQSTFARCRGYIKREEEKCVVWTRGRFTDDIVRSAFLSFQRGLRRQKPFMEKIVRGLDREGAMTDFLRGDGILEAVPTPAILFEILESAGFSDEEILGFVAVQTRLCDSALSGQDQENPALRDYRGVLAGIVHAYAAHIRERMADQPNSK